MKYLTIFFVVGIIYTPIFSQSFKYDNNVFLEAFGNGGLYSINYDRILYDNISVRAGAMIWDIAGEEWRSFPLILNYRIYVDNNYFQLGLGTTIFSVSFDFGGFADADANGTVLTGVIGYCFQGKSGINARIAFTPFYADGKILPFGGLSLGYSF